MESFDDDRWSENDDDEAEVGLPQTAQAFALQEGSIRQSARQAARHEELGDPAQAKPYWHRWWSKRTGAKPRPQSSKSSSPG
jgi:hypothetical protein